MNLQHERIAALRRKLKLSVEGEWPTIAQEAARSGASFADFLERLLTSEQAARGQRRCRTLLTLAGLPALKTLEQFDWAAASGAPKAQIQELAGLAFIERAENVLLPGPSGVGKTHLATALALDGKLLLVTNTDLPAAEVLARYKALADIERGFRVLKNDLAIGPVYHRLPERIRAHALICFLALVLYRIVRMRLKASGSATSPRQALALLRQIQQHWVSAAGKTYSGISRLHAEQRDLFKELRVPVP